MARHEKNSNGGNLGFEAELFKTADKLRGNMEPSDYKHVALGLIFLKYISDAFEARHAALLREDPQAACLPAGRAEDRDEYLADNVFWVPKDARWSHLKANAKRPEIGTLIDDAMRAIEKDNESLKGVLPKDYARPALNKLMLGELIDLIGTIDLIQSSQPSPQPSPKGRGRKDTAHPSSQAGADTSTELPSPPGRGAGGEGINSDLPSPPGRGAGGEGVAVYRDISGFCKSATLEEIRKHGHVLTPGRYVGAEAAEDDGEAFADKMQRLSAQWREQQQEAARLDAAIEANPQALGF